MSHSHLDTPLNAMRNLAGAPARDDIIRQELRRCGIHVTKCALEDSRIDATVCGVLGPFRFSRRVHRWQVEGDVPVAVARELYLHPVGKEDIRVEGDGNRGAPEAPRTLKKTKEGLTVFSHAEWEKVKGFVERGTLTEAVFAGIVPDDDPRAKEAREFVPLYHIDSELGLYLFVETLKKHGLVDGVRSPEVVELGNSRAALEDVRDITRGLLRQRTLLQRWPLCFKRRVAGELFAVFAWNLGEFALRAEKGEGDCAGST